MKHVPLFPRPVSWLSAALLYVFLGLWMTLVGTVGPRLVELLEKEPRLAALGFLGLWIAPIAAVATFHHVVHAVLDRADRGAGRVARGIFPGLGSLWAGVFAWLVLMLASSVTMLLLFVLYPPPPADQMLSLFAWPFDGRARAGIHTVAWVILAAELYDLERAIRARAKRGDDA